MWTPRLPAELLRCRCAGQACLRELRRPAELLSCVCTWVLVDAEIYCRAVEIHGCGGAFGRRDCLLSCRCAGQASLWALGRPAELLSCVCTGVLVGAEICCRAVEPHGFGVLLDAEIACRAVELQVCQAGMLTGAEAACRAIERRVYRVHVGAETTCRTAEQQVCRGTSGR